MTASNVDAAQRPDASVDVQTDGVQDQPHHARAQGVGDGVNDFEGQSALGQNGEDGEDGEHLPESSDPVKEDSTGAQWPKWFSSPGPKIANVHQSAFGLFTRWMAQSEPNVWTGQAGLKMELVEQRQKRDLMVSDLAGTAQQEVQLCNWWDRIVATGTSQGLWKIPLCRPVVKLSPPKSDFFRRDFQLLGHFRTIQAQWELELKSGVLGEKIFDMIVASSILCGGVTDLALLMAISCMKPENIAIDGSEMVVFLQIARSDDTWGHHIWFPDMVSASLIVRWLKGEGTHPLGDAAEPSVILKRAPETLRGTFQRLGWGTAAKSDAKVQDFLRAARVAQGLQICGYSTALLAGDISSQSLPIAVTKRLRAWPGDLAKAVVKEETQVSAASATLDDESKSLPYAQEPEQATDPRNLGEEFLGQSANTRGIANSFDPAAKPVNQLVVLSMIRAALSKKGDAIKTIDGLIAQRGASWWPILYQLACWVKWRLGSELKQGNSTTAIRSVKAQSANRYLSAIARHLIVIVGQEDLLEMEVEDIEFAYEQCCERVATAKERGYFWMCVHSFQQFLVLHGAPVISFDELDGYTSVRSSDVSANIVGEHEFAHFKSEVLRQNPNTGSPLMMILLVAILGFRLGLRRREVQMLWVHNLHWGPRPMLKVRASAIATLKSSSAKRILDLYALVPNDELQLLRAHCELLQAQMKGEQVLAFCKPDFPRVPLPQADLFDPLTRCFQRLLGTDGLAFRFHHFRHSFATWTFLLLAIADNPELLGSGCGWLARCGINAARATTLKLRLYPRLQGIAQVVTRSNLYMVASMLGHLSPLTTLKYYIHLLDWLSAQEVAVALATRLAQWKLKDACNVCGLSLSMSRKLPYSDCEGNALTFLRLHREHGCKTNRASTQDEIFKGRDLSDLLSSSAQSATPGPLQLMLLMSKALSVLNPWWSAQILFKQQEKDLPTSNVSGLSNAEPQGQGVDLPAISDNSVEEFKARVDSWMKRMEVNHSIDSSLVHGACSSYLEVTAKHNGFLMPDQFVSMPRLTKDRAEFWRILDATTASFKKDNCRNDMVVAANFLVRRKGPNTGNINLYSDFERVVALVRGLIAMGVSPKSTLLEVRVASDLTKQKGLKGPKGLKGRTDGAAAFSSALQPAIEKSLAKLGVTWRHEKQYSPQALPPGGMFILKFAHQCRSNGVEASGSKGAKKKMASCSWFIRSLNMAAIWVLFASAFEESSGSISGQEASVG
jgi:integrase